MSTKGARRPGELGFVLAIGIFSALALWQAYRISGFEGLSTAGVFPMLAAATMLVAALFIVRDTISKPAAGATKPGADGDGGDAFEAGDGQSFLPLRLILMIGLVFLYVVVMPYIGFMLASAGFLFIAFSYLWRKNLFVSVALTAVTLACVYGVFRILFQVVLPQGTLVQGLFQQGLFPQGLF